MNSSTTRASLPITPIAIAISCLFSLIVILQNPLLNDDAYKYLRAAELYMAEGAQAMLSTYGWFHYSILIAWLDRLVPGDALFAARLLNTALYALLTWVFIRLSRELRATRHAQLFAALCILVLPLTNEMRYFLMRDAGFWVFALWSAVLLIEYRRTGRLRTALWWCLALVAAVIFRLEALLLLALAPFSLLIAGADCSRPERLQRFARLMAVLAGVAVSVLLACYAAGFNLIESIAFAYRYYLPALADLLPGVAATGANAGAVMFTADNYPGDMRAIPGMAAVLFGDGLAFIMNLVNALSIPVATFLLYYRMRRAPLLVSGGASRVVLTYAGTCALALLLFVLTMHFLTQRYAALLALLVLCLLPAMLDDVLKDAQLHGTTRRLGLTLGFFCFYFCVDSLLSFGYSQQHIDEGIAWTRANLPATATLKTNNFAIAYHSDRIENYDAIERDMGEVVLDSASGDYLILEIDRDASTLVLDSNAALVVVTGFRNERGDEVRVYQRR